MSGRVQAAALLLLTASAAAAGSPGLPWGWSFAGAHPQAYAVEVDRVARHAGQSSLRISKADADPAYGAVIQTIHADRHLGRRLRLSAWVKTEGLTGWAGLVVRIEGARSEETLAFDNMQARPLRGTAGWRRCEVVLDVPPAARLIHFGFGLSGAGRLWLSGVELTDVERSVPTTSVEVEPAGPINLDFEK